MYAPRVMGRDALKVYCGDVVETLPLLDTGSVNTIVTSPPYVGGVRDYGTAEWIGSKNPGCQHIADATKTMKFGNPEFNKNRPSRLETKLKGYYHQGFCPECGATSRDRQIGQEETVEEYVSKLVSVFGECRRILTDDGLLFVNIGDAYNGSKSLFGAPYLFAYEMIKAGWILRNEIVWQKTNPIPSSAKDRLTRATEPIFMFSRSERYYAAPELLREPGRTETSRHPRNVWTMNVASNGETNYATFPIELPSRCIDLGCPPGGTVLDPFAGTGTTAEAALNKGCNAIAIELHPDSCKTILNRCQPTLFEGFSDAI